MGEQGAQQQSPEVKELTVCDIIGDWGLYQWSVCLFALLYSALAGIIVVVGPIWSPDLNHVCAISPNTSNSNISFASKPHECFAFRELNFDLNNQTQELQPECTNFVYDDQDYGKILTNSVSETRVGSTQNH